MNIHTPHRKESPAEDETLGNLFTSSLLLHVTNSRETITAPFLMACVETNNIEFYDEETEGALRVKS